MAEEQWLTIAEAATRIGVTRRTMHRWIREGRLKAYRGPVRHQLLFKPADVEAFRTPRPVEPDEGKEAA